MTDTLLIIEAHSTIAEALALRLEEAQWRMVTATSLKQARRLLLEDSLEPHVVVTELELSDGNSLDLLEDIGTRGRYGEWIGIGAPGMLPDAARAARLGFFDVLERPLAIDRLWLLIQGAARSVRVQRQLQAQIQQVGKRYSPDSFIGQSPDIQETRHMLTELASAPFSAVVIQGETGTGKGLAARILHYSGRRAAGPLVELNCAALPSELLESELFGHEAGAFTGAKERRRGLFEQAQGGTLFLDEIAEMPLQLQAKLLKALEDHSVRRVGGNREINVDVCVVVASNQELKTAVANGVLRGDLYHRLSVVEIWLPPLRKRPEDLPALVYAFIAELNHDTGKRVSQVPEVAWAALRKHTWPGNVRELRNAIERCVLLSTGPELAVRWLQLDTPSPSVDTKASPEGTLTLPLDGSHSLDDMERLIIRAALERTDCNITAAARLLSTSRQTLRYRIAKHDLNEFVQTSDNNGNQ